MKATGLVIFSLIVLAATASAQKAEGCLKADRSEKTVWGRIMENNPTEGGMVKRLQGRVEAPDESVLSGALVEVFDNPDLDVEKRKRLAACRTGEKGVFRFIGIPPGRYEIRASYRIGGFDAGQTLVTLAPNDAKASEKDIIVRMELSN